MAGNGSGVLNVTVGEVGGKLTVVVAMGGVHRMGGGVEAMALHVFDAVERAVKLLEKRGDPVEWIVMDSREVEAHNETRD